jgi:zinc/manganese transport system substrate-binding protein
MPRLLLAPLLAAALLGAGCGSGATDGGDRLTVVATTTFAAELAAAVAGEDAEVVTLVPSSANPHSYAASAKDRAALDRADLVVAFGHNYEEGLPLDRLRGALFEIAEHVGDEHAEEAHEGEEEGADAHGHEGRDPHVWMDPLLMAGAATELGDTFAEEDPARAAAYRRRAEEHRADLTALHEELRETLASVPAGSRKLVTSHDSLAYFAERYGFTIVATPFGLAPEAQASAQGVADVVAAVRREGVPVVFGQRGDDPRLMRRIAEEAGVTVIDDLLIENPAPGDGGYADALRFDARRIAGALAP